MFKLFIRWNFDGEGFHKVELELDGQIIQTSTVIYDDNERIYGYCCGVVDTLTRFGIQIELPRCMTSKHVIPDMSRQD